MADLVTALVSDGCAVQIRWQAGSATPAGLENLLTLERSLLRRFRRSGSDPLPDGALDASVTPQGSPDIIVDLTGQPARADKSAARWLQVFFNGASGEDAVFDAVLHGDLPQIEIC